MPEFIVVVHVRVAAVDAEAAQAIVEARLDEHSIDYDLHDVTTDKEIWGY